MYSKKQADVFIGANARWNILAGAVRSGKTFITYDLILKRLAELPRGARIMIGRTQQTLERNVLNPMRERYGTKIVSHINSKNTVHIGGQPFYVVGADNKEAVTKIQGLGLVYGYGDEITTWNEDVFQMLKSRLSDAGARFDGTCNPAGPKHWLKKDIIDNNQIDKTYWKFEIDDNPFLDPQFVCDLKREYAAGVWHRRFILGEWCVAEGIVYPMFDPQRHVTDKIPKIRSIDISVDVGQSNATVFLAFGEGEDNRIYLLSEYYHSGRETGVTKSPHVYAQEFVKWSDGVKWEYPDAWIDQVYIDPSAKGFWAELNDIGIFVRGASNDVLPGIQAVSSVIDRDLLRIHPRCTHMIDELGIYSWDDKAAERGEDAPVKEADHCCDCLRYRIFSRQRDFIGRVPIEIAA